MTMALPTVPPPTYSTVPTPNRSQTQLRTDISNDLNDSLPSDSARSSSEITSLDNKSVEPPYHVFSMRKKKCLMWMVSAAGMFSSLSTTVYFPALGQIAEDLNVSEELVNLSVTTYMILQALAPSFWGPLADAKGRRPTLIATFIVYLIANIGLAFTRNFPMLMTFRAVQAAGSSATISLGAGVIADICTAKERGNFNAQNQGIRQFGLAVGPVFGGIIAQYLGYRAIFWFLFGLGALNLAFIVLLLPETLRSIAGNGTILLKSIYRPLLYKFETPSAKVVDRDLPPKRKFAVASIFVPLTLLFEKDVFMFILYGSWQYTIWSMMTSSTTILFQHRFGLNDLDIGLCFIPCGVGSIVGSWFAGKIMTRDYTIIERRYRAVHNIPDDVVLDKKKMIDFPFEKARLRNVWWMVLIFIISTTLYGFSLHLNILAIPLILQFVISYTANSVLALNQTLIVDMYPSFSASAASINNLARCSLGAVGVALIQLIINRLGSGPTFAMFAGITAVMSPLLVVEWFCGERWRRERKERVDAKEQKKRERDVEGSAEKK